MNFCYRQNPWQGAIDEDFWGQPRRVHAGQVIWENKYKSYKLEIRPDDTDADNIIDRVKIKSYEIRLDTPNRRKPKTVGGLSEEEALEKIRRISRLPS